MALDADEIERYWQYLLAGGDKKKWRWSSADQAGTRALSNPSTTVVAMARAAGALNGPRGSALEFARATGRPIAYRDRDGNFIDEHNRPVEIQPGFTVVIPKTEIH
jgi:hypothetical protein